MNPKGLIKVPDNDWIISQQLRRKSNEFIRKQIKSEKNARDSKRKKNSAIHKTKP